jgi:hypothetical protein
VRTAAQSLLFVAQFVFGVAACASGGLNGGGGDAPGGGDGPVFHDAPQQFDGPADSAQRDAPAGSCADAFTGVLATWDFTTAPGSQAGNPAKSMATGVTAGMFTRSPAGLTATSGLNSINSSAWPTAAALDATKYYTVTITPPSGCTLSLTSMAIDAKSSGTGPASAVLATSVDQFAATSPIVTSAPSTPTLAISGSAGAVELRFYGYSATSASGTLRVQNTFSVTGSLQ